MHREFRKLLDAAVGISEFVFAVNIDIRGFSDWSLTVDSAQTAIFVKKIYTKLIDGYFSDAAFVKPTGDGLLVVVSFEEEQLTAVATKLVRDAIQIVENFGMLCATEEMINFPVPQAVGIGLARGAASRLASGETTLDYSGRVLNLAARLMDLARPHGVVLDAGFGLKLLPDELQDRFRRRDVYLKGVSPTTASAVYCWPTTVEIPTTYLHPLGDKRWEQVVDTVTIADLEQFGGDELSYELIPSPCPTHELFCIASHDAVTAGGRKSKKFTETKEIPVTLVHKGAIHEAEILRAALLKYLRQKKVGATWGVRIELNYRSL
jgi:class 3 adenylate cyclase